ncbi:MAG: YraN family protein [Planctomycetes bacterium]|nr:YraN family protein [Planctomycetota bacterium]
MTPAPRRRRPDRGDHEPSSGARGEELAAAALAARGYRVVARNLRTRYGEIDLLLRRRRTWIAVEVKARRDHPAPERCVEPEQLDRIERSLLAIAAELQPRPRRLRIDVVSVRWSANGPDLLHFPSWRSVAWPPVASGSSHRPHAARPRWSTSPAQPSDPIPLTMPALAEQIIPRRKLLLMLSETTLFMVIVLVGTSVPPLTSRSFVLTEWSAPLGRGLLTSLAIALICQASLSYNDLYDWKTAQNRAELANRLVRSCGYALVMLGFLSMFAGTLLSLPGLHDPNGETWKLILLVGIAYGAVFLFRHAFHWFFYKWRFGERVLVLGSSNEAVQLSRMVLDNPHSGYELVGLVEEPAQPPLEPVPGGPALLGPQTDLRGLCREEGISRIVVALRERRGRVPVDSLLACRMDGVQIEEREAMYERLTGKLAVESMRHSYLIYGRGFTKDPLTMVMKRVLDILASTLGLVLSLPLWLFAAVAIKLTSRGPIFFSQERVGQDGQTFHLIKFRTMRTDAEKESGPVWAQKNDHRVTKIGRLLRRSRIDEIPQFLNILGGQMSFVGPRPERPHFVAQLQKDIPFYPLRHTVKPGLTGWAQVRHPYGASTEDAQEKLRYDLYYIKNLGFLFDLNIILRTVAVILRGQGSR